MRFHTPLTDQEQLSAGLPAPWPLAMADKVRFAELDRLGHVNNAAYLPWFENLRIRYFADWGISTYQPSDPRLIVARAEIDYLAEMFLNDTYIITIRATAHGRTSFTLGSQLWSRGILCARYSCVVVQRSPDGSEKRPLSAALLSKFREIDGIDG